MKNGYFPRRVLANCRMARAAAILLTITRALCATPGIVIADDAVQQRTLKVAESWHLDHATHHVQGLAATPETFWITSVDREAKTGWIYRVERRTMRVVAQRKLAIDAQYHPGGVQLVGGKLWVPLAEYRPRSSSTLLALDPATLATRHSIPLDDHIGALAADGRGTLYAGNWDCRQIYVLDEQGKVREKVDSPTGVAYQDFEFHDGRLWGVGRLREGGKTLPVVDTIEPGAWRLRDRFVLTGERRSGGSDFAREGFTKLGDSLFVLPEDGPDTTVYRFPLP